MEFFHYVFSQTGTTILFIILVLVVTNFMYNIISRLLTHKEIMKHGYEPTCDNEDKDDSDND